MKFIAPILVGTLITSIVQAIDVGMWQNSPNEPIYSETNSKIYQIEEQIVSLNKNLDSKDKSWRTRSGYTIQQSIFVQRDHSTFDRFDLCQLGVLLSVKKGSTEIVKVASPLNLTISPTPSKTAHYVSKDYGPVIDFGIPIVFDKTSSRDTAFSYLYSLNKLCVERSQLIKVAKENQNRFSSIDDLAQNGTTIPDVKKELADPQKGGFPLVLSSESDPISVALLRGRESFAMRWRQLEELENDPIKRTIRIQVLDWRGDEAGVTIGEKLIRLKQKGHNPIVYIDTLSPFADTSNISRLNTMRLYYRMMAAGIPVYGFNCSKFEVPFFESQYEDWFQAWMQENNVNESILRNFANSFSFFHKNLHEKIWTIEGKDAIMGGMNMLNYYFGILPEGTGNWKDQDFIVKGEEVNQQMKVIFDRNVQDYAHLYKDPGEVSCYNPYPISDANYNHFWNQQMSKMDSLNFKLYYLSFGRYRIDRYQNIGNGPMTDYDFASPGVTPERLYSTNVAIQEINYIKNGIIRNIEPNGLGSTYQVDPKYVPVKGLRWVPNRPKFYEHYISDTQIKMIDNAQKEIWIINSYFIPYEQYMDALQRAAARGVNIYVLSNSITTNDISIMVYAQRYNYKSLMDISAGTNRLRIFEWTGRDNNGTGVQRRGMIHAKFMIVDGKTIVGGSYNIDNTSENGNSEIILATESEELAAQMMANLKTDYFPFAREISYEEALSFRNLKSSSEKAKMALSKKLRPLW